MCPVGHRPVELPDGHLGGPGIGGAAGDPEPGELESLLGAGLDDHEPGEPHGHIGEVGVPGPSLPA